MSVRPTPVSLTVRRPTPVSREDSDDDGTSGIVFANGSGADDASHHTDASDEEDFIAGSKLVGGPRLHQKKKKAIDGEALVIPTRPNPDWREAARRRRAACARVPPASTSRGADGSVGGLGTRDTINSGPQLSGLQINKRVKKEAEEGDAMTVEQASAVSADHPTADVVEETEDQRALRALLAGEDVSAPVVEIIPVPPLSEADALKQDVQELPDVATVDDYERVPISAFGAAMLRGMGWTDGAVASKSDKRRKNGLTELYLPQARPAMLGIGAKEREAEDDGSGKKKSKGRDMRYIPLTRRESGRGENGSSRSGTASRRSSHSPSRQVRDDRERRRERDRDRDRGSDESRRRTKDYDDRGRERRDHRDKDRDRDRSDPYQERERDERGKRDDQRDRTRERDRRDRRDDR